MLELYITRHGETEWNVQKRMQGWSDSELTENGRENARALGNRLVDINFSSIYSSPSKRTLDTAKIIRNNKNTPIILEDKLKEIHMGDWEGETHQTLSEKYPAAYTSFWETPHLYESKSGENFTDLFNRAAEAVNRIITENTSGRVLMVTHSVIIKCLFAYFKNRSMERLWDPPYIHDTSLTIVYVMDNGYEFLLEGDLSHRKSPSISD